MTLFRRESRYIVMKVSDVNVALSDVEREQLSGLMEKIVEHRQSAGKAPLECVVVEADWPIYDSTWDAVEQFAAKS
jgi:hypothetical protein